jgi:hypothetical protein
MDARRKTAIRLSEDVREGFGRVAAKGSFNKTQGKAPPFGEEDGGNPFDKGGGGGGFNNNPSKRNIPEDHEFDKKAIKPIVKTLWAMSVALGHALTAHRQFSRLKSSTFSPDGLLGGRGYVLPIKDIRQQLFEACENLSALVDTLHDEINAPHWKPKLADLEKGDLSEVERLLADAEDWVDNPEEEVEEEQEEVEKTNPKGNSGWTKDRFKEDSKKPRSDIPSGGDKETTQKSGPAPGSQEHPDYKHKQASAGSYDRRVKTAEDFLRREVPVALLALPRTATDLRALYERFYREMIEKDANSSVDPGTLPGPRVDHLDRADDGQAENGSYNREDPPVADQWGEQGGVSGEPMSQNDGESYAYPGPWSGQNNNTASSSKEEDAANYDFTPSRSIYNPHGMMPGDPEAPMGDRAKGVDHYETVEDKEASDYNRATGWTNPTEPYENHEQPYTNPESPRAAASGVPDSNSDSTPGQAYDFGIGDGNGNDAHGQAAGGYGTSNPGAPDSNPGSGAGNRGVYGPQSGLPDDPGGSTKDREHSDTTPSAEQGVGNSSVPHEASAKEFWIEGSVFTLAEEAATELPNDDDGPVARSDYYWGDKGNDFNYDNNRAASPTEAQSRMPGNNDPQPAAPSSARPMHLYEHEFASADPTATSGMPGDENAVYDSAPGYSPDEWHRTEHGDQPYTKWDDDTHNMRPDYTYQRGDLPAPYVNQDL